MKVSNFALVAAIAGTLLSVGFTVAHAYLTPEAPIFAARVAGGLPAVNRWYGFLGGFVFPHISLLSMYLGILSPRRGDGPEVER